MRYLNVLAVAGAALLVAGAANAAGTDATGPDAGKIVCKSGPPPTGTRLGATRVCKTQGEWDRERREAQDNLTRMQTQRGVTGGN